MAKHKKKKKHNPVSLGRILAVCALLLIMAGISRLVAHDTSDRPSALPEDNESVRIPAQELMKVVTNPALDSKLLNYKAMDVSFNPRMHEPNWVAWELTADETNGDIKRSSQFYSDDSVEGCAETYDYLYSGYDRGHMAPAGDMKWDATAMRETFCMVNICPQAKVLNTGAWKRLEEKCRSVARADSAIIIICGPVLTDTLRDFIGDNRVAVPKRFFKVILSPYTTPVRGIGFIMPNDRVKGGMQATAVSIDEVERITGHDFFSALPDSIELAVEKECDFNSWSNRR